MHALLTAWILTLQSDGVSLSLFLSLYLSLLPNPETVFHGSCQCPQFEPHS